MHPAPEPAAARPAVESCPPPASQAAPWILLGAVAAAYATAFGGGFVFDDWRVVVHDPRVQSLAAWWRSMPGIRPLLKLSYAANQASGLGLAGFHAVNLALHAANTLLVHGLLLRLGRRAGAGWQPAGRAALLGALLFALHPAQTEAVTYVCGRSSSLAALLVLASLLAWMEGRERGRWWLSGLLSPLLFAAALAAKEMAFILPAALLLVGATDPRRPFGWHAGLRAVAGHVVVLAIAAGGFLALPTYRQAVIASLKLRHPLLNLATQLHGLAWLAGQALRPDRLSADPGVESVRPFTPGLLAFGLLLLALAVAGLALARRRPAVAFAILWCLLWSAPASWVLPRAEPSNDRQLYLALIGPAWLAGLGLASWQACGGLRRAAALALPLALGAGTALRNTVYLDELRFWEDVVRKSPENPRAHNNLGFALAAACRREEAQKALERALELDLRYIRAAVNLRLLREGAALGPDQPECR